MIFDKISIFIFSVFQNRFDLVPFPKNVSAYYLAMYLIQLSDQPAKGDNKNNTSPKVICIQVYQAEHIW